MAGWFSRIIKGGERTEAEPVEFALTCRCGQIVTGIRGRRMQVAVCRECAYQICVLPVSPYPRPKVRTPKKKPAPPPLPKRQKNVLEEDDSVSTPPPIPRRTDRSRAASSKKSGSPKPAATPPQKSETPHDEFRWQTARRRIITPLRLTASGMIAVVILAGWWVWHQRALSHAVVTFATATKSGRSALATSQFDQADQQFRRAVSSLDLLGREDREARQVRQQAREAAAANGLAMISLFDLLSEARQTQNMASADWQKALRQSYQGDWFLLESNGLQFASNAPTQWTFTLPLVPGAEPVQVRGDLSKWSQQLGSKGRPAHFVLAGQLADIRSLGNGNKGWEIVLASDSICLWTDPATYTALGGTLDEGTLATLKSQAQLLGVAE